MAGRIRAISGILLLAMGCPAPTCAGGDDSVSAPHSGVRLQGKAALLGGYSTNPVFVSDADKSAQASPLWAAVAGGDLRIADIGDWSYHTGIDGEAETYTGNPPGNVLGGRWLTEAFYFPGGKRKGAKRKAAFLSASYKLDADKNTILSNPDRFDERLPELACLVQRARLSGNLPLGRFGGARANASAAWTDFSESTQLLASLDSRSFGMELGWVSPRFLGWELESAIRIEKKDYLVYPSRDVFGDTVSGAPKSYLMREFRFGLEYAAGRKFAIGGEYTGADQTDNYAGYFNAYSAMPGFHVKWRPSRALEFAARGEKTFRNYARYRSYYNPLRPLKKIAYTALKADARYEFGIWNLESAVAYRSEDNPVSVYAYDAWKFTAGAGISY